MKWLLLFATVALAATLSVGGVGCKKGETDKAKTPEGETKYTVEGPADTNVSVGDKIKVILKIDRKKGFEDEVEFEVTGLPDKVTATPDKGKIGKDAKSADIELKADSAAKEGEKTVTVKTKGGGATKDVEFKLNLKKKG